MNESMESIKFDDRKGLENLKETDSFYLDPDLQKELRDLTTGNPEILEENSERILENLKNLRDQDPEINQIYNYYEKRAKEYASVLRPCHETSGTALLQILADGRFLNHYEADRQYPDINKRTTEADKAMNSDMSVFCTFNLFRGLSEKYSVIFNKEVLEKATSYVAFNDLADLLPGGINASHYDSKKYLDQYRKRIIPGKHARKAITEILATFQGSYKNFDDSVWGYKEIFEKIGVPTAYRQGGSPEIQLYNPTVEDIEAVLVYDIPGKKINSDINDEELKMKLDSLGIPIKYASNIPEVAGQSSPETIFKELDGQKKNRKK